MMESPQRESEDRGDEGQPFVASSCWTHELGRKADVNGGTVFENAPLVLLSNAERQDAVLMGAL